MITIRDDQRAAMERLRTDDDLVAFILDHVRAYFPGRFDGIPDDLTEDEIRAGLARARGWGLTSAEDLCVWVSVMYEVAARFDEAPGIRAVLADERLGPPSARLARLFQGGLQEGWEEAEALYDDAEAEGRAWQPDLDDEDDEDEQEEQADGGAAPRGGPPGGGAA